MLSKRYVPVLLISLSLVMAASFPAFAEETDDANETEGSSLIVTDNILKIWEQAQNDEQSGPSLLEAFIGKAAADPDATGIASAVIGKIGNGQIDLPGTQSDTDALMEYYMALAAMLNNIQANTAAAGPGVGSAAASSEAVVENTPITDAEGRELIPLGRFAVTEYCGCSKCGSGTGMTASGKHARSNHTIAADTRLYPFGTQLMVNGIIYTVEDTGGSVRGNTVDIFVDSHAEAVAYGTHYADVYLVK